MAGSVLLGIYRYVDVKRRGSRAPIITVSLREWIWSGELLLAAGTPRTVADNDADLAT